MSNYLSPYTMPDKNTSTQNVNTNPYSYNPPPSTIQSKIGASAGELRLISKKSTKLLEALTYILKEWDELKQHVDFVDKNLIVPRADQLFKNILDEYVAKILLEPLNFILEVKKHKTAELMETFCNNPYLLSFDTRVLYFKIAAFASFGEFHRSIHFLTQYLRKKHTTIPDSAVAKLPKEKCKIDRRTLLQSCVNLFTTPGRVKQKNFLEIQYCNEEGTGLGPTLEFYYLCSKEFRHLKNFWRETEDNSLFPLPYALSIESHGEENVLKYFETLGALISRAISDDRLTDLPFSSVFWDACIGKPMTFKHISKLDSVVGKSINELREYSLRRKKIIDNPDIEEEIKQRQLSNCRMKNDVSVEDLCLYFVIPGTDLDLKENGKDIIVTDDNLEEYLDLLLDQMLGKTIRKQVKAFRKGFGRSMEYLQILRSEEIELIVCGNNDDDKEWTIPNLKEHIIPAHGYHETSSLYLNLLDYMASLNHKMRRQFLTFVTGSPRLPLGGKNNIF